MAGTHSGIFYSEANAQVEARMMTLEEIWMVWLAWVGSLIRSSSKVVSFLPREILSTLKEVRRGGNLLSLGAVVKAHHLHIPGNVDLPGLKSRNEVDGNRVICRHKAIRQSRQLIQRLGQLLRRIGHGILFHNWTKL